jgi:hypothetical protein
MTNIEIVGEQIEAWPDGICDKCIGLITDVKPHQQVVQICHKLAARRRSVRVNGKCQHCGDRRFLNRPMTIENSEHPTQPQKQSTVTEGAFKPPDFDDLRRLLIQYLRTLDYPHEREGFSRQVIRLRDQELLPWNVAALMLTHSSFRNHAYYEAYECTTIEAQIIALIDAALRVYLQDVRQATI